MRSDPIGELLRAALGDAVHGEHDALRVRARSVDDVRTLFHIATRSRLRIAAPGGEILGGAGVVSLDLDGLDGLELHAESYTVHVAGGATLDCVEARLQAAGLTLGQRSTDFARRGVAAWLACGAPGARAHADDPVDQLVCGLEVVLADGTLLAIRPAPRRAVGPDLVPCFVGGRACLGVIVGAHLVARTLVPHVDVAFRFPTRLAATSTRAWVRGLGVRPASTSLSGESLETVLSVRVEGCAAVRAASLATVERLARERGGVPCEPSAPHTDTALHIAPPSDIVRALARTLDPEGTLRADV